MSTRRYGGRCFTPGELDTVRAIIAASSCRAQIARRVCRVLDWHTATGALKAAPCRRVLLRMHRDGLVVLPPPRHDQSKCQARVLLTAASAPQPPLAKPVHELAPPHLEPVCDWRGAALWREYVQRYHYLGYTPIPGAQLRYFAHAGEAVLGVLGFGAGAWRIAARDRFIGWSTPQREAALHLVVNNARFLILPWVRSKNLASRLLALAARQLPRDWEERYGYRPVLLETFVPIDRFPGTCYRAAGWTPVGVTTGRGKRGTNEPTLPKKQIWLRPLTTTFQRTLCGNASTLSSRDVTTADLKRSEQ